VAISLVELARANTVLSGAALGHAQRLVATWQTLADLCFSDLLLLAPVSEPDGQRFVVLGHVRPTTGQTLYPADLVGAVIDEHERAVVGRAWREGQPVGGDTVVLGGRERAHVQCIPVRWRGELIGVVTRESAMTSGRRPGELEHHYLDVFERFARMIAAGSFPFEPDEVEVEEAPRVADGVIVLDESLRIRFASPNAVTSLHRMGIYSYAEGLQLSELGFDPGAAEAAAEQHVPSSDEVERGDTSILLRAIPLLDGERVSGVLLLIRDVTDLRHRDRILVSKDATIREIHHRVKNNLQTIAALLQLQGRRVQSQEAREAIEESERRIRAIAIVHETLSRDVGEVVRFRDIVDPLVRVVEETVSTPELHVRFVVEGEAGDLSGELATPLAVVLNELMQNAVDHAFPASDGELREGRVRVVLSRDHDELVVDVIDDGVGLPSNFTLDSSSGLGLSIVHTLVTSELGGTIEMHAVGGTQVRLQIPLHRATRAEL
jgi:two-component system, sensor histidine kinase PdtaS